MKTIPPACPEPEVGPKYWRSLDQLADTAEFRQWVEREYPHGAAELQDGTTRRYFMKLMSASFLLAGFGLAGCRRPEENILPFTKMPEDYVHGMPQYYATSMPTRGSAVPLVVKAYEGRPVKIEGNSQHPDSSGGTDQFAQASILGLYDPDRAIRFAHKGESVTREVALDNLGKVAAAASANGGSGLSFLLERSNSPSRARLQKAIALKYPNARWYVYEPLDFDVARQAASIAYGKSVTPYYKFAKAKVILTLDADILGAEENSYLNIRGFAKGRRIHKPGDGMNRLYTVEGVMTVTGANSDHRLRIPSSQVAVVAASIAQQVLRSAGLNDSAKALDKLAAPLSELDKISPDTQKWVTECAKDLIASKGQAVVVAGHRQPLAVQVLAHAINFALGSVDKTVSYFTVPESREGTLADLAKALNAGQVDTLVELGGNTVYTAPADLNWANARARAKELIRLGYYEDESFPTFPAESWNLSQAHYLESWGDARTADGTLVPVQPLIEPLFGSVTELEVLARIGGFTKVKPYDIVRETFASIEAGGEEAWKKFLHDGFLANSASLPEVVQFDHMGAGKLIGSFARAPLPSKDKLEVVFTRSAATDDGRFNNNGWLQEIPDPITKIVWDNAILVSPATAAELGVGEFDDKAKTSKAVKGLFFNRVVEVTVNGLKVKGAVWIQPGMADNVVALSLGYGREKTGRIGRLKDGKTSGYNAYSVRTSTAPYIASGATLIGTSESYQIASTQEHGAMEGRPIIREANKDEYEKKPDFAKHMDLESPEHTKHIAKDAQGNPLSIYPRPAFTGLQQWGMSIDLNTCVGCTACVVACQSENNIPIVGKEQVTKGREMSWIRIDRYYMGTVTNPQVVHQPMLCQHCENAPCESVCPVNATAHTEEGLNVMAYNRCVGTRYCSNNCPYKVRRFNYFDYNRRPIGPDLYKSPVLSMTNGKWELARWFSEPEKGSVPEDEWELLKLVRNPDVSVRMRGIMEKCSFCVQRIEQAKIARKVKAGASGDVKVPDGTLKTACQQACPAEAIVFGDVSDPKSAVSKLKKQQRDYSVLGFLDTKPRTTYLARIRNPNPAMPHGTDEPESIKEYEEIRDDSPFGHEGHEAKGSEQEMKGAH